MMGDLKTNVSKT